MAEIFRNVNGKVSVPVGWSYYTPIMNCRTEFERTGHTVSKVKAGELEETARAVEDGGNLRECQCRLYGL